MRGRLLKKLNFHAFYVHGVFLLTCKNILHLTSSSSSDDFRQKKTIGGRTPLKNHDRCHTCRVIWSAECGQIGGGGLQWSTQDERGVPLDVKNIPSSSVPTRWKTARRWCVDDEISRRDETRSRRASLEIGWKGRHATTADLVDFSGLPSASARRKDDFT